MRFKIYCISLLIGTLIWGPYSIAQAALTTDNIKYANSAAITITLNSLASSSTVGRSSTAIDNSANLYIDAYVTVISSTSNSSLGNDKAVYIYVYGSEDGTNFEQEESSSPFTDGSYTINNPTIFRGPVVIPVATSGKQYIKTFSVNSFFGGILPRKWGIIVINFTGQALASAGNSVTYSGVTYTNQ